MANVFSFPFIKKRLSDNESRRLVTKLFDGDTTVAEEKELYAYFRRKNIPADLEAERATIMWMASGLDDAAVVTMRKQPMLNIVRICAAVAAIIVVSVSALSIHVWSNRPDYSEYKGSYAIINGKKISDIEKIYPLLIENEKSVCKTQASIALVTRTIEEQLSLKQQFNNESSITQFEIEAINRTFSDPEERRIIIQALGLTESKE